MKQLLVDIIQLDPPTDFDPNKYDLENQIVKRQQEAKKIEEIIQALELLTEIYTKKDAKPELRSLARFKAELPQYMKESQI